MLIIPIPNEQKYLSKKLDEFIKTIEGEFTQETLIKFEDWDDIRLVKDFS